MRTSTLAGRLYPLAMITLVAVAGPARAELQAPEPTPVTAPSDAPLTEGQTPERGPRGVWMGDQFRYPRYGLFPGLLIRIGMDTLSIPSSVGGWSGGDWAVFGAVVGSAVLFSIPFKGESLDVRFQSALTHTAQTHPGQPLPPATTTFENGIWTPYGSFLIYTGVAATAAAMILVGSTSPHPDVAEAGTLAVEGMIVAEIYHTSLKLLIGREGPLNGERKGAYHGPTEIFFPNGTPSGHASALGGFIGALATYYDEYPLVGIILDAVALTLSVALITDNLHWTSDVIVGLVGGYAVGRWVVHHRSSRYRNADGNGWRRVANLVQLTPAVLPNGGGGLGATIRF